MADRSRQGPPGKRDRPSICPICRKPSARPAGPGESSPYPFCSERCRLVDLGRWLDGVYQIPAESREEEPPAARPDAPEGDSDPLE